MKTNKIATMTLVATKYVDCLNTCFFLIINIISMLIIVIIIAVVVVVIVCVCQGNDN